MRAMGLRFDTLTLDCAEPERLARWWGELLGWPAGADDDGDWVVEPPDPALGCALLFGAVPEPKAAKNRVHLDLRPDDQEAEVARAVALGATTVDIGQGDQTWVVLADPEGNEFCILRSRPTP
jgi:hypothetical protein